MPLAVKVEIFAAEDCVTVVYSLAFTDPSCLPLEGKGDRRRRWMRWNVTWRLILLVCCGSLFVCVSVYSAGFGYRDDCGWLVGLFSTSSVSPSGCHRPGSPLDSRARRPLEGKARLGMASWVGGGWFAVSDCL